MILVAVFTPPVAVYAPKGFRLFRAVVRENGCVSHTQSIFSVYPHRDPYPPPAMHNAMPQGDTMMPFCEGL